jgi:opacity protein-like surface antigen
MKSRIALSVLFVLLAASAFAADTNTTPSDAQKSFDKLKALAGTWEGTFEGHQLDVTLRVTSMGNALMHEMKGSGPEDPITMFNLDADRLLLTHYCDAGNRPRMVGKISPDGKTLEFEFLDVSGSTEPGHMQHVTFTFIDADHHIEKWQFAMADGKTMGGVLELKRTK